MDLQSFAKGEYDPDRDEITGCDRNTLVWHHEDRHRQQYNNNFLDNIGDFTHLFLVAISPAVFILLFTLGTLLEYDIVTTLQMSFTAAGITSAPYILFQMILEIDATAYQIKKWISGDYITS